MSPDAEPDETTYVVSMGPYAGYQTVTASDPERAAETAVENVPEWPDIGGHPVEGVEVSVYERVLHRHDVLLEERPDTDER